MLFLYAVKLLEPPVILIVTCLEKCTIFVLDLSYGKNVYR